MNYSTYPIFKKNEISYYDLMRYLLLAFFLFQNSFLSAILSPMNQSAKEIEMILQRPELTLSLGQDEEIEEILHLKDGYLICTKEREVKVDVIYQEQKGIGAKPFILEFHGGRRRSGRAS